MIPLMGGLVSIWRHRPKRRKWRRCINCDRRVTMRNRNWQDKQCGQWFSICPGGKTHRI